MTRDENGMNTGQRTNAPIFVVGHPRSGTTLLRLMLNEHPRIVIPAEAHVASYLRRVEQKYGSMKDEANRRVAVERLVSKKRQLEWELDRDETYARAMQADSPGGIFDAIMQLWCERTGKARWGEKTPGTYRFLPEVNAWFPECQVIHIIRDGRDVAVSCLTPPFSDNYDKGNVYEVALRWRDAIQRCRRAAKTLGPQRYLQIRYEDLADDPEGMLKGICEFLREDFAESMLDYHKNARSNVARGDNSFHQRTTKTVNKGRVERWRTDADDEFVCGFEGIAGKQLTELGYSLSGKRPTPAQRMRIVYEKHRPRRLIRNYKPPTGSAAHKPDQTQSA